MSLLPPSTSPPPHPSNISVAKSRHIIVTFVTYTTNRVSSTNERAEKQRSITELEKNRRRRRTSIFSRRLPLISSIHARNTLKNVEETSQRLIQHCLFLSKVKRFFPAIYKLNFCQSYCAFGGWRLVLLVVWCINRTFHKKNQQVSEWVRQYRDEKREIEREKASLSHHCRRCYRRRRLRRPKLSTLLSFFCRSSPENERIDIFAIKSRKQWMWKWRRDFKNNPFQISSCHFPMRKIFVATQIDIKRFQQPYLAHIRSTEGVIVSWTEHNFLWLNHHWTFIFYMLYIYYGTFSCILHWELKREEEKAKWMKITLYYILLEEKKRKT